jgi:uncharacterized membrane protein YfcA
MSTFIIVLASIGAFVAGVVDAIAGGGGVINLPILMSFGFPVDFTLGTSKLISTSGTLFASANFIRNKKYSQYVVRYHLICTCVGAALGAFCASYIVPEVLKPIVSVLIIAIALYLFFKPKLGVNQQPIVVSRIRNILSIVAVFAIGFYDGIFGPGTGAFLTFMFIKLLGQDFLLAVGNTKILNLASNAVALCIFVFNKKIIWSIGIPMALANMAGGYLGAQIAMRQGAQWVRWIFIVMACVVGVKQLF